MSAATKAALDAAIEAHVADEMDGAMVSAYVLNTVSQRIESLDRNSSSYYAEFSDNQDHHVGIGLASMLLRGLELGFFSSVREGDD
jgi:hypothetical protein